MSRRWKKIKKDPARLSAYKDRARQVKNDAEEPGDDSQNEKTVVDKPAVRIPQEAPKSPEFVDTCLDNSDDEQERVVKNPQKAPKSPEFVDTDSGTKDEQEPVVRHLQKVPKIPKFVDTESSIEDEQESTLKQPQKVSKTLGLIETGPEDKDPKKHLQGQCKKNQPSQQKCSLLLTSPRRHPAPTSSHPA